MIDTRNEGQAQRSLRLWPGVAAAVLLLLVRFVAPVLVPEFGAFAIIGMVVGALVILLWWMFFSRAPWSERLGAIALMIVALLATSRIVHESIANGMMGMMIVILGVPVQAVTLVAWAVATRRAPDGLRRASMVAAILLASGAFALLRTGGISGAGTSDLSWRWTPSPEERLLSEVRDEPVAISPAPTPETSTQPAEPEARNRPVASESAGAATSASDERTDAKGDEGAPTLPPTVASTKQEADWSGFRGVNRDGVVHGVRIDTDWSQSPPVQLWTRAIGPGWSSFAVDGDLLYTQEQRGDDEIVAAYRVTTGEPVWRHRDGARFWESNGGAGPRATPTLSGDRVYAFGATGILNVLDAGSGAVVWSRNVASETETEIPGWGFASSPLVVGGIVVVAPGGKLVAYDRETGERLWVGPPHGGSYSSPQLVTIDRVPQVLQMSEAGLTSVAPGTGALLWEHMLPGGTIVQPAQTEDGDILLSTGGGTGPSGTRRIGVAHGPGGWTVDERWTSNGLKPYFNDFVVHKGHAFGFDGSILASIDLQDGKRKWKGGRYGNGQLVLLPDQDVLLVLSEEGELALVSATPDQFKEIARFPAIHGKTWNHPVLVKDILLVRNGEEMAAYRLSPASR
jgi:outer membrane protein assembly factor BamB